MRAGSLVIGAAMMSATIMSGGGIAAAQPADVMPHDGVYLVGVDIQPGVWEAPGTPDPAHGCDWRRLRKVEGDNTDMRYVIANNYTRQRTIRVTIKPTDAAFTTKNCGPWRLLPPPPPSGSFGG
ncbi:hypothetical protein [Nocardia donostiensis]|uniref:Secreted protein n=1 Tax=Nocardia donostiensis TaxID=1538463 RepID=A0A1W0AWY3_9NOCA|nr:hypothetical protein [Nocardia donostiensis]ONM49215.1 hypothetical protein B0T46_07360 [Nocardia donostiensis]OQS14738.1 hypothetical protein B0T36_11625 [Nocardia donostiensis]OQS17907.1 hypothetical protein B0T44_22425 [Nocardia donostiensis]